MPDPTARPALVLPVRAVRRVARRAVLVGLDLGASALTFTPGQAVNLGRHGQPRRKPYSIASAPEDAAREAALEFLIALDAQGRLGEHLGPLGPGDLVDVEGPFGSFGLPPGAWDRCVLVGGGTGIAPLRAMWRHLRATRPAVEVALLCSARTGDDVAFRDEVEALARASAVSLTLTATREPETSPWPGERGRLTARHLAAGLTPTTVFVVCGPPAFVAHVTALVGALGIAPDRLVTEGW